MAGINDYTLDVILKAKAEGLAAFAEVSAGMAAMVAQAELANRALDDMNSRGDRHTRMLQNISNYTRVAATEVANLGMKLEGGLTPALDRNVNSSNNASSSFMRFIQGMIPGQQTAGNITIAIAALTAVFAPFTVELAASLVLLGAWVVGATAFIGVIALAAGGIGLLVAGVAALGLAQMGGIDPAKALETAQKQLATATNQTEAAQEAVAKAQLSYTTAPTAMKLLTLQQAQEQLTESQQKQVQAQNAVNTAQANANGPVGVLHQKIEDMAAALGQRAVPMVNAMAGALIPLVPRLQAAGESLMNWFGPRLPQILQISNQAFGNLAAGMDRVAIGWGQLIDHVLARSPEFGNIVNGAFNRVIDGALGLLDNLVKLSDWFVQRLPTLGKNANDTLANLGIVVQAVGKGLGNFVDWIILHWPEINRVFNAAWDAFKSGWLLIQPFLGQFQIYMTELLPLIKFISDNLGILKIIMEGMGAVVLVLVAALFALFAIGVLVVAGAVAIGLALKNLDERAQGVWKIVVMMAKEAWPALSAAGQALGNAIGTLLGTFASLFDSHEKTVASSGHVQKAVHDTRDSFTQFMTSSGVIGILAFLSVQLPADILIAATWLKVLADRVALNMVLIGTTIKVTADIARGDWAQAGADMVRGQEAASALMKKDAKDTSAAMILTDQLMNGTIEAQTESFKQAMITKFTDMNTGTTAQVGNMKDQHLHHIQELNDRIVGKSIVPDMVNSVISWFNTMSSSTTSAVNGMADAIGSAFGGLGGKVHGGLLSVKRVIDGFGGGVNTVLGPFGLPHINVPLPGFASGGVVPGYAPGQDSVLARLSPGEGVLTPQTTRALGGASAIDFLNQMGAGIGATLGTWGGQCVPFVEKMLGTFWPVAMASQLTRYMNSATAKPGEAAVFTGGLYGHVALVTGPGDGYSFPVIDSNWVGPEIIGQHVMNKGMYGFAGFIDTGAKLGTLAGIPGLTVPIDLLNGLVDKALAGLGGWEGGLAKGILGQTATGIKHKLGFDSGGQLPPGPSLVYNGTGRTENVTPGDTMDKVIAVLQSIDTRLATLSGQPRLSGQLATQRNG